MFSSPVRNRVEPENRPERRLFVRLPFVIPVLVSVIAVAVVAICMQLSDRLLIASRSTVISTVADNQHQSPRPAITISQSQEQRVKPGDALPDTTIFDAQGQPFPTSRLNGRYSVLIFGCLTCPHFRRNVPAIESIYRDFSQKDVNIFCVYKTLAHPEFGEQAWVEPFTVEERIKHIHVIQGLTGATVPWLADSMQNSLGHRLGQQPNSEFVLDPDGRILSRRDWFSPEQLRGDLEKLVGKVDQPTRPEDLNLEISIPERPAARGVLARVLLSGTGFALRIQPQTSASPFFVKLRAEVDQAILQGRAGKMYLGFHLDPIFRTHWNNLALPLSFQINASTSSIAPVTVVGPRVDIEADLDPREFLVDVSPQFPDRSFDLVVNYTVCSDASQTCHAVTQKYVCYWELDSDAGAPLRNGVGPSVVQ